MLVVSDRSISTAERGSRLQVMDFLEVRPPDDLASMLQAGQLRDFTAGMPPMLPETRERLQQFFEPYNQQLGELLSDAAYAEWN